MPPNISKINLILQNNMRIIRMHINRGLKESMESLSSIIISLRSFLKLISWGRRSRKVNMGFKVLRLSWDMGFILLICLWYRIQWTRCIIQLRSIWILDLNRSNRTILLRKLLILKMEISILLSKENRVFCILR